jgi:transcriptional regulator with XRE-family HTH domain
MSFDIHTNNIKLITIGDRIKLAMEVRGMSQADMCRSLGIKSSSMSNLLSGKTKKPAATTLMRLADILDVSQKWIMEGVGSMEDKRITVTDEEIHRELDKLSPEKKQAIFAAIQAFLAT